jgi:anti-sigma-K factor RskA
VVVGLAVYEPMHREHVALQTELAKRDAQLTRQEVQLARQEAQLQALESQVQNAAMTIRLLRSPAVQVVSLGGAEAQPEAAGRIFWDKTRGEWRFFAANMRPAGPGKTYQLWFVTDDQRKISAGTFDVDPSGESEIVVKVPEGIGRLALAAVTDEPAGGVPQPTGHFQLLGKIPPPAAS